LTLPMIYFEPPLDWLPAPLNIPAMLERQ